MNQDYIFFTFESFLEQHKEDIQTLENEFQDILAYLNQIHLEPKDHIVENIVSFAMQQEDDAR